MFSGIWAASASGGLSEHSDTASEITHNGDVINSIYHNWTIGPAEPYLHSAGFLHFSQK